MPELGYGTDQIIYNFYNKNISTSLCFIHPNMITLFRGYLLIPLIKNLKNNESILTSILLSFIVTLLDFVDGAHARKCNISTIFGGYLDAFFDVFSYIVITYICIIKIYNLKKKNIKNKKLHRIYFFIGLLFFYFGFLRNLPKGNDFIAVLIQTLIVKLYLNNYTKTFKEIYEDK